MRVGNAADALDMVSESIEKSHSPRRKASVRLAITRNALDAFGESFRRELSGTTLH